MDIIYDFVESIHVFIPIVAVVFLILIVFLCGISRSQQPPDEYLDKLKEIDLHSTRNKKKIPSQASKPLGVSKTAQLPSSVLPQSVTLVKQQSKSSSPEKSSPETTLRQRKTKKSNRVTLTDNEFLEVVEPNTDDQDNGWVTVTPKRRPRPARSGESENDYQIDATPEPVGVDSEIQVAEDENQTSSDESVSKQEAAPAEKVPETSEIVVPTQSEALETNRESLSKTDEGPDSQSQEDDPVLSTQSQKKRPRKKHKSAKPAFEIEEPTIELEAEPSSPEQPEEDIQHEASGSSVEVGTDALEVEVNAQIDNDSPEPDQGEDDGEWTTAGEKKKRKKKKKKDKKHDGTSDGASYSIDDIDDDQLELSPLEQSSPQVTKRRRARKD